MLRLEFLTVFVQHCILLSLTSHPFPSQVLHSSSWMSPASLSSLPSPRTLSPLPSPHLQFYPSAPCCPPQSPPQARCLQHTCHWKVSAKVITSALSPVAYFSSFPSHSPPELWSHEASWLRGRPTRQLFIAMRLWDSSPRFLLGKSQPASGDLTVELPPPTSPITTSRHHPHPQTEQTVSLTPWEPGCCWAQTPQGLVSFQWPQRQVSTQGPALSTMAPLGTQLALQVMSHFWATFSLGDFLDSFLARSLCSIIVCQ